MEMNILAFFKNEDGAVTVDFVVLTGAICLLGLLVVTAVSDGALELATATANAMGNMKATP
ncbi:hypothetical protein N9E38_02065 [Yoonia sp.]|nr:hypothetical protein [Yoonia sp.]